MDSESNKLILLFPLEEPKEAAKQLPTPESLDGDGAQLEEKGGKDRKWVAEDDLLYQHGLQYLKDVGEQALADAMQGIQLANDGVEEMSGTESAENIEIQETSSGPSTSESDFDNIQAMTDVLAKLYVECNPEFYRTLFIYTGDDARDDAMLAFDRMSREEGFRDQLRAALDRTRHRREDRRNAWASPLDFSDEVLDEVVSAMPTGEGGLEGFLAEADLFPFMGEYGTACRRDELAQF